MTIARLSNTLNISERAVSKQLRNLQQQGRLRRVGPDKGGHWEVLANDQGLTMESSSEIKSPQKFTEVVLPPDDTNKEAVLAQWKMSKAEWGFGGT